jgi:hypothetical protein
VPGRFPENVIASRKLRGSLEVAAEPDFRLTPATTDETERFLPKATQPSGCHGAFAKHEMPAWLQKLDRIAPVLNRQFAGRESNFKRLLQRPP